MNKYKFIPIAILFFIQACYSDNFDDPTVSFSVIGTTQYKEAATILQKGDTAQCVDLNDGRITVKVSHVEKGLIYGENGTLIEIKRCRYIQYHTPDDLKLPSRLLGFPLMLLSALGAVIMAAAGLVKIIINLVKSIAGYF